MTNQYNFYNIEASFKQYLLAGNKKVTVKNYLSDFRHFLGWFILKNKLNSDLPDITSLINIRLINEYKSYLIENKIPVKTINRRLSTIRKFCSFCISQGWMKENPGKQVQNIRQAQDSEFIEGQNQNLKLKTENLLNQFEKDLIKEKTDRSIINSCLNDVQELLQIF